MTPEEEIADIAARLLKPAGSAPVFQTAESINANREAFVAACHTTWKDIHKRAIQRPLFFEGWLNREKTNPMGPRAQQFGAYGRAVWRRVNDAIVWNVLGFERNRVKRLCLYRARSNLLECNPNSVMDTLDTFNRDPLGLALWTDATSCVDLGDVFLIRDGRRPVPEFIELKEGAVNEQIIKVMDAAPEAQAAAETGLRDKHGDKAVRQLQRVRRQKATANQALRLLSDEHGIDPVTGHMISVVESAVAPETYNAELREQLDAAVASGKGVLNCVDGCLWIYAAPAGRPEAPRTHKAFAECLQAKSCWYAAARSRPSPQDRDKLVKAHGVNAYVMDPNFVELFYDGVRPRTLAARLVESCRNVAQKAGAGERPGTSRRRD